jgi:4-coumarate--CoA ligase
MKVIPNAQIGQGYGRPATFCSLDADVHRTWNPGLTETSTSLTMYSVDQKIGVPGSAGRLLPGVVARVVKPDGSLAGFNEPGELRVKTPSLALGYWNDEQATKETFVEGWLRTGDEVIIREDKEVFIVDRLKVFYSKPLCNI